MLERRSFSESYVLSTRLDPFLLQGDFDGDGQLDLAVLVEARDTGADGIAIVHADAEAPVVLGAGRPVGAGGGDFSWMDAWHVVSKGPVDQGAEAGSPPELRGDALLVEKLGAANAILYWDGSEYRRYQRGD